MNFDKKNFSETLIKIKNSYGSINKMAEKTGVTAAYISKLIRLMYDNAPSPEILKKIADNSRGLTNYDELMQVCGYIYVTELTPNSYGIGDTYWKMIFGNAEKVKLSQKGSEYLSSFFNKMIEQCNKCKSEDDYIEIILSEDLTIPNKHSSEEFAEYNKIASFVICSLINTNTLPITDSEKDKLLDIVQEHLSIASSITENTSSSNNLPKKLDSDTLFLIPILGRVPAGEPLLADENIEGYLPIDPSMYGIDKPDKFFFLVVQGESMNKVVRNGAYVLVKKQDFCDDNDVIVAIVNGDDEVTLKRFKDLGNGFIELKPESTYNEFSSRIINTKDTNFKILGKVIGDFKKW